MLLSMSSRASAMAGSAAADQTAVRWQDLAGADGPGRIGAESEQLRSEDCKACKHSYHHFLSKLVSLPTQRNTSAEIPEALEPRKDFEPELGCLLATSCFSVPTCSLYEHPGTNLGVGAAWQVG